MALDHNNLMLYLASINSLEAALHTLREERNHFVTVRNSLGKEANILMPGGRTTPLSLRERISMFREGAGTSFTALIETPFIAALPCLLLTLLAGHLLCDVYKVIPDISFWLLYFIILGSITGIVLLYFLFTSVRAAGKVHATASDIKKLLRKNNADYQQALQMDRERVAYERKLIASVLDPQIEKFEEKIAQLDKRLQSLYNLGHLAPEYRNFDATSNLFRYLRSGMCTQLGGMGGAYYMYEMERNSGKIIEAIDRNGKLIASRLNTIIQNQYSILHNQERQLAQLENIEHVMSRVDDGLAFISTQLGSTNATLHRMLDNHLLMSEYIGAAGPMVTAIRRGVNMGDYYASVNALNSYISAREEEGNRFIGA